MSTKPASSTYHVCRCDWNGHGVDVCVAATPIRRHDRLSEHPNPQADREDRHDVASEGQTTMGQWVGQMTMMEVDDAFGRSGEEEKHH